ncbi:hypothetical protein N9E01_00195 [bacterium]|nr:hypothetical protein [bacterium]
MKKILLLLSLVFIISCSKEEGSSSQNLIDRINGEVYNINRGDDTMVYIIDKSNKYIPLTFASKENLGYLCNKNTQTFTKDLEGRHIRREVIINNETRYEVHNYVGSYYDSTVEVKLITIITSSSDINEITYTYRALIGDYLDDSDYDVMELNNNLGSGVSICNSYTDY